MSAASPAPMPPATPAPGTMTAAGTLGPDGYAMYHQHRLSSMPVGTPYHYGMGPPPTPYRHHYTANAHHMQQGETTQQAGPSSLYSHHHAVDPSQQQHLPALLLGLDKKRPKHRSSSPQMTQPALPGKINPPSRRTTSPERHYNASTLDLTPPFQETRATQGDEPPPTTSIYDLYASSDVSRSTTSGLGGQRINPQNDQLDAFDQDHYDTLPLAGQQQGILGSPARPPQLPSTAYGGMTNTMDDAYPTCVTVFGFPPEANSTILTDFARCGTIVSYQIVGGANWINVQYDALDAAQKALCKNRGIVADQYMIGVVPMRREFTETDLPVYNHSGAPTPARSLVQQTPAQAPNRLSSTTYSHRKTIDPFSPMKQTPLPSRFRSDVATPVRTRSGLSQPMEDMLYQPTTVQHASPLPQRRPAPSRQKAQEAEEEDEEEDQAYRAPPTSTMGAVGAKFWQWFWESS